MTRRIAFLLLALLGPLLFLSTPSVVFPDRTLGITILLGQNSGIRNAIYIGAIHSSLCLLLALLPSSWGRFPSGFVREAGGPKLAILFATLLGANLLAYALRPEAIFSHASGFIAALILSALAQRRLWFPDGSGRDPSVLLLSHLLAFQIAVFLSLQVELIRAMPALRIGVMIAISFGLTYSLRDARVAAALRRLKWLVCLPLTLPLVVELQYLLLNRFAWQVGQAILFAGLAGLLLLLTARTHLTEAGAASAVEPEKSLARWYFPVVLLTSVALLEYESAIRAIGDFDYLHPGEAFLPVQQLFDFGSIPYIDFMPPHGLFDLFPQSVYRLLHGNRGAEVLLWGQGYMLGWVMRAAAALILYRFLALFMPALTAFLICILLPHYQLIQPYYVFLLLPGFLLLRLTPASGTRPWMALWMVIACLGLWRIDFGIAALAAHLFLLALLSVNAASPRVLKQPLAGLALTALLGSGLFLALCGIRGQSPFTALAQILAYTAVQMPINNREHIIAGLNYAAVWQLVLLPSIGVLAVAPPTLRALRRGPWNAPANLLVTLGVASLVLSLRSLHRHTLAEGVFNPYLFPLLALLMLGCLPARSAIRSALIPAFVALSFLVLPKISNLYSVVFYQFGIEKEYPALIASLPELPEAPAPRLKRRMNRSDNISWFLRNALSGDETFYDFSNAPLLYPLAKKRVPSFITETLYHSGDTLQGHLLADLTSRYDAGELPIVIFRQSDIAWNALDGVDQRIRSYRVADFVFARYLPCVRLDPFDIWVSKQRVGSQAQCETAWLSEVVDPTALPDTRSPGFVSIPAEHIAWEYDLMRLPYVWARYDEHRALERAEVRQVLSDARIASDHQGFALSELEAGLRFNYLHLVLSSEKETAVRVHLNGQSAFRFVTEPGGAATSYLLRLDPHRGWHDPGLASLEVETAVPVSFELVELLRAP